MGCERYKSWLSDAALGALAPAREAEWRAHVEQCAACRAELERERMLLAALERGLEESLSAEPSPEFAARVRMRVVEEAARPRAWFSGWIPAGAAALAVLVIVAVWLVHRQPSEQQRVERREVTESRPPSGSLGPAPLGQPPQAVIPKAPGEPLRSKPIGTASERIGHGPAVLEVLVAEEEQAGILWLYNTVRSRRVDASAWPAEPLNDVRPAELKIAPLEVAKLDIESKPPEPVGKP